MVRRLNEKQPAVSSHLDREHMKRTLFFIAVVCLAAGFPFVCFAQDRVTGNPNKQSREEWQSRVNANREGLEQRREELRREREERLAPKREELRLDREKRIEPKQQELKLDRENRFESKQEQLRLDRENRFGPKQEELRLDRENRVEPKREELRRERDKQKEILRERKGFIPPPPTQDEIAEERSRANAPRSRGNFWKASLLRTAAVLSSSKAPKVRVA